MKLSHDEERRVRDYLLGELPHEAVRQFEERLLREEEFVEQALLIEDELIEDYACGELNPGEREQFEKHFLTTPRRRRKLIMVRGLKNYASVSASNARARAVTRPGWLDALFAPRWKVAAFALLALFAVVIVWLLGFRQTQAERGLVALDNAYKQQRPLEARIIGMSYARFSAARGGEPQNLDSRARDFSRTLLQGAASDDPNPSTLEALGRFYLTQKEFDKAILQFEEALKSSPGDAQLHSDLGAALLEQAKLLRGRDEDGKVMERLAESQRHLNEALRLNPSLPEASFNRALCLEELMLPEQAREAWQNYLKLDPNSKWAEEAQRHLRDISGLHGVPPTPAQLLGSFVAAFGSHDEALAWHVLSGSREAITRRMIPPQLAHEYAARVLAGADGPAQESLRALLFAGELDRRNGGDPYTAELAAYYTAASESQLRLVVAAARDLDSGYELCLGTKYDEAAQRFGAARATFEEAGNELEARLVDYWLAYCLTQPGRIKESNAVLEGLARFCEGRSYKWLLAQTCWWMAGNHLALNEHSSAIKYYRQSLALAEETSDAYQMQKSLTSLGDLYARLRQPEVSFGYHYRSLALAARSDVIPRQAWRNFIYAGNTLFAFKHYDAAAACINEALRLAAAGIDDPSLVYLPHLNLGLIYSKLRRFDEAVAEADTGLRIAQTVRDPKSGQRLVANATLRQADIRREAGDCGQAVGRYDEAISLYERAGPEVYRYAAYKGRLLCERALGDTNAVGRDIPVLTGLFEKSRANILEEANRNSFFDAEQGVYDIAVEYEYERQNYLGALNYAEAAHARTLLDAVRSGTHVEMNAAGPEVTFGQVSIPEDIESMRQQLPPRLLVLMYAALPRKLIGWSLSRDGFSHFESDVPADALAEEVNEYVSAVMEERSGATRPAAALGAKLFDTLLGPVVKQIKPGDVVCIIPDKYLHRLPFAALISPGTGRYVVEDFAVFYAPSLNVLRDCSEAGRTKAAPESGTLLSIGNPTFDLREHPDLPPLRAAEREAREVAELYQRHTLLLGPEAMKERVLSDMRSAEVIHFAGHYVMDESSPLLSKMLLASSKGSSAAANQDPDLSTFEIIRQRLDRTRLVVLSGCQTGLDRYFDGEGPVGLTRAFMEAKVPLVVASQWPVDSDATAGLMVNFHRNRRSGLRTFEALRKSQADMLHSPDEAQRAPYYWAAFLSTGGYAEY
jgi:CHAT domain-containing protein/tetratricopeptide (TPR) repeat protein